MTGTSKLDKNWSNTKSLFYAIFVSIKFKNTILDWDDVARVLGEKGCGPQLKNRAASITRSYKSTLKIRENGAQEKASQLEGSCMTDPIDEGIVKTEEAAIVEEIQVPAGSVRYIHTISSLRFLFSVIKSQDSRAVNWEEVAYDIELPTGATAFRLFRILSSALSRAKEDEMKTLVDYGYLQTERMTLHGRTGYVTGYSGTCQSEEICLECEKTTQICSGESPSCARCLEAGLECEFPKLARGSSLKLRKGRANVSKQQGKKLKKIDEDENEFQDDEENFGEYQERGISGPLIKTEKTDDTFSSKIKIEKPDVACSSIKIERPGNSTSATKKEIENLDTKSQPKPRTIRRRLVTKKEAQEHSTMPKFKIEKTSAQEQNVSEAGERPKKRKRTSTVQADCKMEIGASKALYHNETAGKEVATAKLDEEEET